jgi:alpha-glucosidase
VRKNQLERLPGLPQGGWPANTLGNHDVSRVYSHFGDGQHDADLARISLALMLTLWGTPFLYNGEEIGMTDYLIKDLSRFKDILGIWSYHMEVDNLGASRGQALEHAARRGRDKCRTPMQWNSGPNGGFCPEQVEPWLPVNPNYAEGVNVSDQEGDEESLNNFYKHLLRLRRNTPALISGEFTPVQEGSENHLAFLRRDSGQICLVILNMSAEPATLTFNLPFQSAQTLFSSKYRKSSEEVLSQVEIAPFEVYIAELND